MSPLSILLLGETDRTEFREARSSLNQWGDICAATDVDAAVAALTEGRVAPDLIVIAQTYPGQFSHEVIDRLRRLAPLARMISLLGSWCEGEMRTGSPWPGVVRTYWHQWIARSACQFSRLADGKCGSWALPATATEEERTLTDTAGLWSDRAMADRLSERGLVLIQSQSREMAQWLSAACRSRGFATVWQRSPMALHVEGTTAAICDTNDLSENSCGELRRLATAIHPAPVIGLLGFPRVEDHRRAFAAGATAVLSKPLALESLFYELELATNP